MSLLLTDDRARRRRVRRRQALDLVVERDVHPDEEQHEQDDTDEGDAVFGESRGHGERVVGRRNVNAKGTGCGAWGDWLGGSCSASLINADRSRTIEHV